MHDGDFEIDILDQQGNIVGSKLRRDVVKGKDIYHAVYCVLITPDDRLAVSRIANRPDLPNLHAGSLGCTAATIRRTGETGDQAMQRALAGELGLKSQPELLSEEVIAVDNTYRKIGLYKVVAKVPETYSQQDIDEIVSYSKEEFAQLLDSEPEKVTPLLKRFFINFCN